MTTWNSRDQLSLANRLRRSYYELLRDDLDQFLINHALINSYQNFIKKELEYPFVEKRELKPRARIPNLEYESHNTFLVIFIEDTIPPIYKKYIRFFNVNKTSKKNFLQFKTLPLAEKFDRSYKYLDSVHFQQFITDLLPVDYALLIQRDPASRNKNRYSLTHFHVRIDWPIAEAAEDLARDLRYISKDIYEKGDKYAEDAQKKFFEYYGLPVMAGGRRTAAIVAAQYLKRLSCISTVYAGSSESRYLLRISEQGVSKAVLVKFSEEEIQQVAAINNLNIRTFKKKYSVAKEKDGNIFIFQAFYGLTNQARPPEDNKLRDIKPDLNWLTVDAQYILPKPGSWKYPPLAFNVIYS